MALIRIAKSSILILLLVLISNCGAPELPVNHGEVESRLYVGTGEKQPLIVGLGGSEGGNAWDSDRWKETRDHFLNKGYAFLALGYFGTPDTPDDLDRISIDGIHDAILEATRNKKIHPDRIALIGGSKGAELALLLASHYNDIKCVVAIVPGFAAFPALTISSSTSSWTYKNAEVPYVPMPWSAVPSALQHDLRSAFEIMLEDKEAVDKALIRVEDINGPILLVSAKNDEMWPSTEMSTSIMKRLDEKQFLFEHKHIAVKGGHLAPLKRFDDIFTFLDKNFPVTE